MMGVFNNLVMFDQHAKQNSLQSIVPDLATGWSWSEDGTELTFPLRQGVKWHDGKPFTAEDVKCTWDLLTGKSSEKLRLNPRKSWYRNLEEVTTNGDYEVTFHLKRPQPAFIALLASGYSVVYPCHVPPAEMRQHPIGTGPFKFVEFKPNERITADAQPGLLENGPALSRRHRVYDHPRTCRPRTSPSSPGSSIGSPTRDPAAEGRQEPGARGDLRGDAGRISRNLIINRDAPPFDNPDLRRAMALSLDRKAFIDIISEGQGDIGGVMQPPPEGVWGMPPDDPEDAAGL